MNKIILVVLVVAFYGYFIVSLDKALDQEIKFEDKVVSSYKYQQEVELGLR